LQYLFVKQLVAGEEVHLSAYGRTKVPKVILIRDENWSVEFVEFHAGFLFEPLII